ncbi:GmrSD restriction endonuclease domain-containing protein [Cryptosporangium minutisporangium]|uniref:GmrSD restriction endonucleases N-terminal domain-containing protein n=1 Tax=Cryptosporangium minutisporangium TaxID=113569 RepID=A0ABP6SW37_9ACTN
MAKLSTILDQIDAGSMLLPEFQRGYVWNRDQVRGFMRSLYLGYPVGSLLVWETDTTDKAVRGVGVGASGVRQLLLDGQQRVTSLYGVTRGRPPTFFEGDPAAFTGLRFNVAEEAFEFYAPVKMKDDPLWIDVTELFVRGPESQIERLASDSRNWPYVGRLMKLQNLLEKEFHAEQITGPDKTTDVVVEIFNRVNSGGTKLSKGDLALAKICAEWSGARPTMRAYLQRWADEGYDFSLDWLLRTVNAVATGRAPFSALDDVSADEFEQALSSAADHIDLVLEEVASRLGLDHARVLPGRPAFAVLSRLLSENGGEFTSAVERDKALHWYVHAALSGRFAGSTETYLNQDLATVAEPNGIDELIARLERWRGRYDLTIDPRDLDGAGKGARFYPLVYLVSRVRGARDFLTGQEVAAAADLRVQPLFGKAVLSRAGYRPAEINAIANFVLVTPETASEVARRRPEEYLGRAEEMFPGLLASQSLPTDPDLWRVERYRDFLAARRELLAHSANDILDGLRTGARVDAPRLPRVVVRPGGDDEIDIRAEEVGALVDELVGLGLAAPERDSEIPDPETGRALSVAEAVWPDGLQPGQGAPVVLELDPDEADLPRMAELGYEVFTSVEALRGYALRRSREATGGSPEDAPVSPAVVSTPVPAADPAQEFHQAMATIYQRARDETGYTATYLLAMLAEEGGVETAKRLLASATVSTGFTALWHKGRLDLTVEALVLDPRFESLFTPDDLDIARARLAQFDYSPQ